MQNPFLSSAGPKFVDREEIVALAESVARRLGESCRSVWKVLLIGSFARGDYGVRSDLDLLVILEEPAAGIDERLDELLRLTPPYPTDLLPVTRSEVEARLEAGDPFISRALREGIVLWSRG